MNDFERESGLRIRPRKRIYDHELTLEQHADLLHVLTRLPPA